MLADFYLWLVITIVVVALLFLMVLNLLAFDELKTDHKNPLDTCKELNPWVLPEYAAHAFITLLLVFTGSYYTALVNVLLVGYHVYRYANRPLIQGPGIYDPTEVFNRNEMRKYSIETGVKLAFYMLTFFFYLYRMMYSLLSEDAGL